MQHGASRGSRASRVFCAVASLALMAMPACSRDQAPKDEPESVSTVQAALGPARLIASYHFDEGSGATVYDASGLDNTGTVSGAAWSLDGKHGGALFFDGNDDRVIVPDAPSLDVDTGLTLMAWVKPTAPALDWQTILAKEVGTEDVAYALFAVDSADRPVGYLNAYSDVRSSSTLPLDTWSHLAFTYTGAVLSLYLNGSLVGTHQHVGVISHSDGPLTIGGDGIWGDWFEGLIDDVRVYNYARSEAEIQSDMGTPVEIVMPNLVAAYHFDDAAGGSLADASGNGNVGTLSGPTWSADGKHGGALAFDGLDDRVEIADAPSLLLSSAMTVMAWVNPEGTEPAWRAVVLKEYGGGLSYGLYTNNPGGRQGSRLRDREWRRLRRCDPSSARSRRLGASGRYLRRPRARILFEWSAGRYRTSPVGHLAEQPGLEHRWSQPLG